MVETGEESVKHSADAAYWTKVQFSAERTMTMMRTHHEE